MPAEAGKWSPPPAEMASVQRELDRRIREVMGREAWAFSRRETVWEPAADMIETKDAVVIRGEKGGPDGEAVEVRPAERTFGAFERRIDLTAAVAPDGVKANLAKGVLTLTMPRREAAKPRAIPIPAG